MLSFPYLWDEGSLPEPIEIVTWADGTDAQIAAMVAAADNGDITLTDYWSVGDERTVHLGAIPANSNGAFTTAMDEQDVVMVIMNVGYMNQEGIHFVVGQKDCLNQRGRMNTGNFNRGSWNACRMRTCLNQTTSGGYYYAIPDDLKPIFKEFTVTTSQSYTGSELQLLTAVDKFALFAEKEVFGDCEQSISLEDILTQIQYYTTSSNIIKNMYWWERSPKRMGSTSSFCYVTNKSSYYGANYLQGISPFGCI